MDRLNEASAAKCCTYKGVTKSTAGKFDFGDVYVTDDGANHLAHTELTPPLPAVPTPLAPTPSKQLVRVFRKPKKLQPWSVAQFMLIPPTEKAETPFLPTKRTNPRRREHK